MKMKKRRDALSRKHQTVARRAPTSSAKRRDWEALALVPVSAVLLLIGLYTYSSVFSSKSGKDLPLVTYGALGQIHTGQLGNQMFQVASTVGIALDHGLQFDFLRAIEDIQVGKVFDLRTNLTVMDIAEAVTLEETDLNFQRFVLPRDAKVVSMGGYLQSPLYFAHHTERRRELFSIRQSLLDQALPQAPEVFDEDTACLHVRRGDYVQLRHIYTQLDRQYYSRALLSIPNIRKVVVMSNDVEWCRNEFQGLPYEIIYSSASFLHDFSLLSQCSNLVIANSSFSWWAAFLNTRVKRVIAPSPWYKRDGPLAYANTPDMYLSSWRVIDAHV